MDNKVDTAIEEELESLQKDSRAHIKKVDSLFRNSERNLDTIGITLETFYFICWSSVVAIAINLLTNIIHSAYSSYSWYNSVVFVFLFVSVYGLITFVSNKWKKIKEKDPLIKNLSEGVRTYPEDILKERKEIEKRLEALKNRLEQKNNT